MKQVNRIAEGRLIDRDVPITFTFNGRTLVPRRAPRCQMFEQPNKRSTRVWSVERRMVGPASSGMRWRWLASSQEK